MLPSRQHEPLVRYFFKSLSWLLFLNLLIKPLWIFGIDRQVQNVVGHEVYGTYFALLNLCYVLLFIADAGLSSMLTQKLAASEGLPVRQLLWIKLGLIVFYSIVCFLVAMITGVTQWGVLLYLVLIQSFTSLFVFLRGLLTARQHFKADAFFSILDKTLLLFVCGASLYGYFRPMTLLLFLQLQTFSISMAVISLLILLIYQKELTTGRSIALKTLARWTAPFVLIILLMSVHNRLDAFLLERLHPTGARQAGIYAAAYRLLDAANVAGFLMASFLLPFLSRNQQIKPVLQKVILLSRHALLLVSAVMIAFVIVFAPWLQQALYYTTDAYSSTVMQLCLAALPAYYLIHIYGTALTATAHFKLFIQTMVLATVLNVLLNSWLIPIYGAMGCCIAALVTQYGCGLLLWIAASRRLAISASASTAALYPATAFLFGAFFYFGQKLTGNVWIILSSIAALVLVLLILQRNVVRKIFLSFYK